MSDNGHVVILDYGTGNLESIFRAVSYCGCSCKITGDKNDILKSSGIILPGVGAFGKAMEELKKNNMVETLKECAASGKYILGICLGMQLLFDDSEEYGHHKGLGLVSGTVKRLPNFSSVGERIKHPYIGWNNIYPDQLSPENTMFMDCKDKQKAFFIHSYYVKLSDDSVSTAFSYVEDFRITVACQKNNVIGMQFHPEKSGQFGLSLVRKFTALAATKS